jgi:hypothetical protein
MKRNLFTEEEVTLCTYLARFGRDAFNEEDISHLKSRSIPSIKMKVQNIAAMLNEEGFNVNENISLLSGKPSGERGRRTNWNIVKTLLDYSNQELLVKCKGILQRTIES